VAQQCQEHNINYEVVDASSRAWDVWRDRYDSLVLFTPPWLSSLPWLPMNLPFYKRPTKDHMADYLETYEKTLWLNVVHDTKVHWLQQLWNRYFAAQAHCWSGDIIDYTAQNVVVAVWPYSSPFIPAMSEHLSPDVQQLHVSQYKNPSQIPHDSILIIWWWNSWYFCAKFWLLHALNGDYPCWKATPTVQIPLKDYLLWTKYTWMTKKPGVEAMSWDLVKFADNDSMRVQSIIRATWYKESYPWIDIKTLLDSRWSIIQNNWISIVPWIYDMTCIERIDSSVRVGKQIVKDIVNS
jgi:putative flavoprotein involved in K+ transport